MEIEDEKFVPSRRLETQSAEPALLEFDPVSFHTNAIPGISLAGFAYAWVLLIGSAIWSLFFTNALLATVNAILSSLAFGILMSLICFAIASVSGAFSATLIYAINWTIGCPLSPKMAVIATGSLAGYLPTVAFVFGTNDFWWLTIVGPVLAASMGACGASWTAAIFNNKECLPPPKRSARVAIKHLLAATAWCAILLSISNLFGGDKFFVAVAGWIVLQAAMFGVMSAAKHFKP